MQKQSEIVKTLSDKELYANVYMTQVGIFVLALISAFFFQGSVFEHFTKIIYTNEALLYGSIFAFIAVALNLFFTSILPSSYFDDGGINERIFRRMHPLHIVFISMVVAVSEEILFRAILQEELGLIIASVIFALIHIRYVTKPFLFGFVIILSFALGILYMWTGNLLTVIVAHFLIDAILGFIIRYKR
ncbi:CPBP family intramembrane metalloprotease [Paenalkalicoccus suaedae]|uniref:CPBP family intramembrane metalloprotease n=1 Tax=Paenalkalicoccus suaedae TaxID=2592382 RepID=A0A859FDV2_9BACI|nr:CPBP family intramembrane glutamic endopeptidase [Paenalkalicoccus suaedae]QKS71060.1 CPBP family intramembrane metalloprotease [Paenalkalicoccus suaedae]